MSYSHQRVVYPFGVVPRLVMVWLTTEALRREQRELRIDLSLNKFMDAIGVQKSAKNHRALIEQTDRLLQAPVKVTNTTANTWATANVADGGQLWWTPKDPEAEGLLPNEILLSESFYREIRAHSYPVNMDHLAVLRSRGTGGLAIDIYCWLAHRAAYLRKSSYVTWEQLAQQFGSQYKLQRQFKAEFIKALVKVIQVWPDFKVQEWEHGLVLQPSKTPVQPRRRAVATAGSRKPRPR